jgi:hypothetical protein
VVQNRPKRWQRQPEARICCCQRMVLCVAPLIGVAHFLMAHFLMAQPLPVALCGAVRTKVAPG